VLRLFPSQAPLRTRIHRNCIPRFDTDPKNPTPPSRPISLSPVQSWQASPRRKLPLESPDPAYPVRSPLYFTEPIKGVGGIGPPNMKRHLPGLILRVSIQGSFLALFFILAPPRVRNTIPNLVLPAELFVCASMRFFSHLNELNFYVPEYPPFERPASSSSLLQIPWTPRALATVQELLICSSLGVARLLLTM